jgi:phosphatidylserine/phosphatidylglycerophosphate/cardiolipin synthase-like enzyme
MTDALGRLSAATLTALADKLERGTLAPPYGAIALDVVDAQERASVASELEQYRALGVQPAALACFLRAFGQQRARVQQAHDAVELVWTGPDVGESHARDAAIVAAELFSRAERSVLVATYALYNGREVFRALAQRMDEIPELRVTLVVNVERAKGDTRDESEIVREFADRFTKKEWSGKRLPDVFFDRRALLSVGSEGRAVMHAKCVVVDERWVLVTSANFTEAAHSRNVEAGLTVGSPVLARSLTRAFERLISGGALMPLAVESGDG